MLHELLIVFALILANDFFPGAEMAIVASRRGRLTALADRGDARAEAAARSGLEPRYVSADGAGGDPRSWARGTLAAAYGGDRLVGHLSAWIADRAPPATRRRGDRHRGICRYSSPLLYLLHAPLRRACCPSGWPCGMPRPSPGSRPQVTSIVFPAGQAAGLGHEHGHIGRALRLLGVRKAEGPSASRSTDIEHLLEAGRAGGCAPAGRAGGGHRGPAARRAVPVRDIMLAADRSRCPRHRHAPARRSSARSPSGRLLHASPSTRARSTIFSATSRSRTCSGTTRWAGRLNSRR